MTFVLNTEDKSNFTHLLTTVVAARRHGLRALSPPHKGLFSTCNVPEDEGKNTIGKKDRNCNIIIGRIYDKRNCVTHKPYAHDSF